MSVPAFGPKEYICRVRRVCVRRTTFDVARRVGNLGIRIDFRIKHYSPGRVLSNSRTGITGSDGLTERAAGQSYP